MYYIMCSKYGTMVSSIHRMPGGGEEVSVHWKRVVVMGVILAGIMFFRGWMSLSVKSATYDEWGHLGNGIRFLHPEDSRFPMDLAHMINPPFARILAAFPIDITDWQIREMRDIPRPRCRAEKKYFERLTSFPFQFDFSSVDLLKKGRLPGLLFSLLGIPLLIMLGAELGDIRKGIYGAFLYSFSPNMLAHARLMTPDASVSVLFIAVILVWIRMLRSQSAMMAAGGGVLLGIALATKYSAGLMVPVLSMAWLLCTPRTRLRGFGNTVVAGIIAAVTLLGIYSISVVPVLDHISLDSERGEEVIRYSAYLESALGRFLIMPAVVYRYGALIAGNAVMKSYLLGRFSFDGWLSYFPVAVAIKTPLSLLLLVSCAVGWHLRQSGFRPVKPIYLVVMIPLFYIAVTLLLGIQVGLRHILPVYPFLCLIAGSLIAEWARRRDMLRMIAWVFMIILGIESILIHPHYLAFFNIGTGNPSNGSRYLVDCNLDWGQDLPALARYQKEHDIPEIRLSYFGTDDPSRYGINYSFLCRMPGHREPPPGLYAMSATYRQGLYHFPGNLEDTSWFRSTDPDHIVAYTIMIYDLRDHVQKEPEKNG